MCSRDVFEGQENFSYAEAVVSCQGLLNQLCCAVSALEAHKPELLDQTKPEHHAVSSNTICLLVKCEKLLSNGEFTLQGLSLI